MGAVVFNRLSFSIRTLFKFLSGAQAHKGFYHVGSDFHVGLECVREANALSTPHESPLFPDIPWELLMVISSFLCDF